MATAQSVMMAALGVDASGFHRGIDGAKRKVSSFDQSIARSARGMAGLLSVHAVAMAARAITLWSREIREAGEKGKLPPLISEQQLSRIESFEGTWQKTMLTVKAAGVGTASALAWAWERWTAAMGGAFGQLAAGKNLIEVVKGAVEGARGVGIEEDRQRIKAKRAAMLGEEFTQENEAAAQARNRIAALGAEVATIQRKGESPAEALAREESELQAAMDARKANFRDPSSPDALFRGESARILADNMENELRVQLALLRVEERRKDIAKDHAKAQDDLAKATLTPEQRKAQLEQQRAEIDRRIEGTSNISQLQLADTERLRITEEIAALEKDIAETRERANKEQAQAARAESESMLRGLEGARDRAASRLASAGLDEQGRPKSEISLTPENMGIRRTSIEQIGGSIGPGQRADVASLTKEQLSEIKKLTATVRNIDAAMERLRTYIETEAPVQEGV